MRPHRNWQAILLILFTTAQAILLSGCTISKQDQYPDTVRVKLPWYANGEYKIQTIELFTIKNMLQLQGLAARFVLSPNITNGKLNGIAPQIKTLKTKDGIYVPIDSFSAELLALYAHFEKLQNFDLQLGVDQLIPNWPSQQIIAVRADLTDENNQKKLDNALYSGELDAYLFVPYRRENLPLSVNAGVIAHEYFHSLFYKLVIQPSGARMPNQGRALGHDSKELQKLVGVVNSKNVMVHNVAAENTSDVQLYHALLFRALNESLADVWGWLYSGDFQFVKKSDPRFDWRDLNQNDKQLYTKEQVQGFSYMFLESDAIAYQIGQMYSRRLFAATQAALADHIIENQIQANQIVGKAILKMIMQLQSEFMLLSSAELMDPLRPLQILQEQLPGFKVSP